MVECFATYPVGRGCTFYLKSYINKLPRLASVPFTEVVLQTLSIQSRDFEEIFLIFSRRRAIAFSATCLAITATIGRPIEPLSILVRIVPDVFSTSVQGANPA